MKKKRMSKEELDRLQPTYYNSVELKCDTGYFTGDFGKIKIISPVVDGAVSVIDRKGDLCAVGTEILEEYPSLEPEPRIETLYECVWPDNELEFFLSDGSWPKFTRYEVSKYKNPEALNFKTGRTLKLNMETWELVEEGGE